MCLGRPFGPGGVRQPPGPLRSRLLLGLVARFGLLELVDVDLGRSVGVFLLRRGGGVLVGARRRGWLGGPPLGRAGSRGRAPRGPA